MLDLRHELRIPDLVLGKLHLLFGDLDVSLGGLSLQLVMDRLGRQICGPGRCQLAPGNGDPIPSRALTCLRFGHSGFGDSHCF